MWSFVRWQAFLWRFRDEMDLAIMQDDPHARQFVSLKALEWRVPALLPDAVGRVHEEWDRCPPPAPQRDGGTRTHAARGTGGLGMSPVDQPDCTGVPPYASRQEREQLLYLLRIGATTDAEVLHALLEARERERVGAGATDGGGYDVSVRRAPGAS